MNQICRKKLVSFYVVMKVRENNADVYCPTCETENCFYISTKNTSFFYDYKKCRAGCHVFNNPIQKQEPTLTLFGEVETFWFAKRTRRDQEEPSLFLKKILRHSPSTATEPETKKDKNTPAC